MYMLVVRIFFQLNDLRLIFGVSSIFISVEYKLYCGEKQTTISTKIFKLSHYINREDSKTNVIHVLSKLIPRYLKTLNDYFLLFKKKY